MKNLIRTWFRKTSQESLSSASYWENRYATGGTSGDGSYGNLARFKADVINEIIESNSIQTGVEFGCGDGNNLSLYRFKQYTGVDISHAALTICRDKHKSDPSKRFVHYLDSHSERADLALSLDVIFHLIEDEVFNDYIDRLFSSSRRFVLIYSSCVNFQPVAPHVRHRNFISTVATRCPNWHVVDVIANRYPVHDIATQQDGCSFSDFYLFSQATSFGDRALGS
jgi:SAM-dependent methyltransferase